MNISSIFKSRNHIYLESFDENQWNCDGTYDFEIGIACRMFVDEFNTQNITFDDLKTD